MVRSLPRSKWKASTKAFYSLPRRHLYTTGIADVLLLPPGVSTSGGVIADDTRTNSSKTVSCCRSLCQPKDTRILFTQSGSFRSILVSAGTGASINRISSVGSALVSRGHGGIDQPNQFTGVGPCVSQTRGHRLTDPVHWGRPLCPADARTLINPNRSLGSLLCLADTLASTNRISSLRPLCLVGTRAPINQTSSLWSALVSRGEGILPRGLNRHNC